MKKFLLLLFGIILMSNLLRSQEITNVTASQRTDGSKMLDVVYDLAGTETEYTVSLEISFDDGTNYQQVNMVSGDVGAVAPATGLQMVWDASTEFPDGFYSETMKVKVSAEVTTSWQCGDLFIDSRDGQEYNTVQIGVQCWMAENLAFLPEVSLPSQGSNTDPYYYVYDYQGTNLAEARATTNYQTFGVLYNWSASIDACPEGWHLPVNSEWTILTNYLKSQPEYLCNNITNYIGKAIAATTNWNSSFGQCHVGNNLSVNNASGFTALPGGFRSDDGNFYSLGLVDYWWTSTEYTSNIVWVHYISYNFASINSGQFLKDMGFNARCVMGDVQHNQPPATPSNPFPENGALNQSNELDLSWICSDPDNDPLSYDIYFVTEESMILVASGVTATTCNPGELSYNTQYYWQVIAHDDQGNSTEGPVWSFTTVAGNLPPTVPSNPIPENGASVSPNDIILSWSCSDPDGDPLTYNVYSWLEGQPWVPHPVTSDTFDVMGTLPSNRTQFWKIVAHDNHGNSTIGPAWSFTTDCLIQPSEADAGSDQLNLPGTTTALAANTPEYGQGSWSVVSGEGGIFLDELDPTTIFTGITGLSYELRWNIFTDCGNSEDYVTISFGAGTSFVCGMSFTDGRDGQEYETVQIGDHCWLAENLNIGSHIDGNVDMTDNSIIEKYCYNNDDEYCSTYGGLYQWNEMMQYTTFEGVQGICPEGWYLPTDADWVALFSYVCSQPEYLCNGNACYTAKSLAANTNWYASSNNCAVGNNLQSNNSTGFSGLPGGIRKNWGDIFETLGYVGNWWSSMEYSSGNAQLYGLTNSGEMGYNSTGSQEYGYSVRCIKE